MKKQFPAPVLALLVTGLLIVTISQFLARKFGWSDAATGFAMGVGVALELTAVILSVRYKRASK
jgi:hypothetical protein